MPHKALLIQLQQQGRIQAITVVEANQRFIDEQHGLCRLQQRDPGYLNHYDQLFRLISMWLLQQGYELTNLQPHQVLKAICHFYCPELQIEQVIQHRHALKKGMTTDVSPTTWHQLRQLQQHFLECTASLHLA